MDKDKENGIQQNVFDKALALLHKSFPMHGFARDHMTEQWKDCEKFLPHVLAFHEQYMHVSKSSTLEASYEFVEMIYSCCWYLFERGRYELALYLIKTAENTYDSSKFDQDELLNADISTIYIAIYAEQTRIDDAIAAAEKARDIRERAVMNKKMPEDHPNRANSFMNLGVCIADKDPRKAIKLHQKALAIREGSDRFRTEQIKGLSLNYLNIGRCWEMVGDFKNAEESLRKCLSIIKEREDELGSPFTQSSMAIWALGNVYISKNQMEEALKFHTKSMELMEQILGTAHLKTAACYHKVASLLHKQGENSRAATLLRMALKVYTDQNSPDSDTRLAIARSKYKLAQVLRDDGKVDEADVMKREAQETRKEHCGKEPEEDDTEAAYDRLVAYFYR